MATKSDEVVEYCRSLTGTKIERWQSSWSASVLNGSLDSYLKFKDGCYHLRVSDADADIYGPVLQNSSAYRWTTTGWKWMEVQAGVLASERLFVLIRDSYQLLISSKKFKDIRFGDKIEILRHIEQQLEPERSLSDFLEKADLKDKTSEINEKLLWGNILIHSSREVTTGGSKLGGLPDLPASMNWPSHPSGKALTFIGQLDLSEVPLRHGLPGDGVLYFFSALGWREEEDADPDIPWEEFDTQKGWNSISIGHQPLAANVKAPPSLREHEILKCVAVDFEKILTLPPPETLEWNEHEVDRYQWQVYFPFIEVQSYLSGTPNRHILLGHPNYIQNKSEPPSASTTLLFQLASDEAMETCFGDGGNLYFFVNPKGIPTAEFDSVYVDYQCG